MNDFSKILVKGLWDGLRSTLTLPAFWVVMAMVALVFLMKAGIRLAENRSLAAAGMGEVDRLSGKDFERFLEVLFQRLGYSVERTQYVGDFGADLVPVKDGVRTVVQAKRYNKKVGIKAVQEVVAAKGTYKCSEAMVVTNRTYTPAAVKLARDNGVRLWGREDLIRARLEMRREAPTAASTPAPLSGVASGPSSGQTVILEAVCATCGKTASEKVRQYCADNAERFGGRVYCYECQRKSVR